MSKARRSHNCLTLGSLMLCLGAIGLISTPAEAQQGLDCAKCETSTIVFTTAHLDQTVCPGPNAVVCDHDYDRTFAKCTTERGAHRRCKVATRQSFYPARTYAQGVCGIDVGFGYVCPTPTGGIAWIQHDEQYCTGKAWVVEAFALGDAHTLKIETPNGPTQLKNGSNVLASTRIGISTDLIEDGLDRGLLEQDGELIYLDLVVESGQPGASFQASKEAPLLEVASGNLSIDSVHLEEGSLVISLQIPLENLGAFADYAVDLTGTRVSFSAHDSTFEAPKVWESLAEKPTLEESEGAGLLANYEFRIFASLASGGEMHVGGSGLAGVAAR